MEFTSRADGRPEWLVEAARSDHLPALWGLLGPAVEKVAALGVALRLRVVLDTSTVIADLRWLVAKRKDATARTALQESMAARVIVACVPPQIDDEVRGNLAELAEETGASAQTIWAAWLEYRRQLTIIEPRTVVTPATSYLQGRDPSDIAFVQLSETVGAAAVLTADPDLLAADARAVRAPEIVLDLRRYAREKAVELTIVGFGTFSFRVGIHALVGAVKALPRLVRAIAGLPRWLHLIIVGAAIWLVASEERRQAAGRLLKRLREWLGALLEGAFAQLDAIFTTLIDAHRDAEAARSSVLAKVKPRRLLLRQAVHAACATATRPLTVAEIEQSARAQGYASAAKSLRSAILRTLRADDRYCVTGQGGWALRLSGVAA